MQKTNKIKIGIILTIVFTLFINYNIFFRNNETFALSKYGSKGEEVRLIQTKLKRWGYYYGNIDGIYGSQTLSAVKWFQSKNGLVVDGIAGKNTLQAMGIFTSSGSTTGGGTSSSNSNDVNLLSRLIYGEARGEPYTGQVAVRCCCFK